MTDRKISESEEAIQLKNRIESWRNNKTSRIMPEILWIEAVSLAKYYSPTKVAKFLKIGHADLIKRIPNYVSRKSQVKNKNSHGFVELPPSTEIQPASRMEVHLINCEGHSAIIHHAGPSTDWENVFSGWFKASRSGLEGGVQ